MPPAVERDALRHRRYGGPAPLEVPAGAGDGDASAMAEAGHGPPRGRTAPNSRRRAWGGGRLPAFSGRRILRQRRRRRCCRGCVPVAAAMAIALVVALAVALRPASALWWWGNSSGEGEEPLRRASQVSDRSMRRGQEWRHVRSRQDVRAKREQREADSGAADAVRRSLNRFLCPDGAVGYKNDDYCDCWETDGSDEPETSACAGVVIREATFPCRDGTGTSIFPSRVGDGIRDCADGSDEENKF
jgi:hypothetical protein